MEGYQAPQLAAPAAAGPVDRRSGAPNRARVRITPEGRRLAAVLQALQPLRLSRGVPPDATGRLEATFRVRATDAAIVDVLALGPEIEVLAPPELRAAVAERARAMAALYDA
ncbi:MAG: WYL domain-containing protein [Chloroflexota bacterium]